jgi:xylulokinase
VEEATVLGAAILAGIGAGFYRNAENAFQRIGGKDTVYEPDEKLTRFYAERFPIFRDLYFAVAPLHHQLKNL